MKLIDIENWKRKEHFEFFSKMASPYFGLTSKVDCTSAYDKAREMGVSFFAYYLHKSMIAVNSIDEFRYRIIDNSVYEFDKIHAGATVAREDETFAFIFVNFSEDFHEFNHELQKEIELVKNSTGLRLNNDDIKKNLIRHSTIPWVSFSGLLHPTNFDRSESVPKITFGKFSVQEQRKFLPVSVEAHHGLMDGLHIARYLEKFQGLLNL